MVIEDQFTSEFEVELVTELPGALDNVGGLFLEVFLVVKSDALYHSSTPAGLDVAKVHSGGEYARNPQAPQQKKFRLMLPFPLTASPYSDFEQKYLPWKGSRE